tara:strand:+ start:74 stop:847 length:774 start_codon:yes stop_codon:yes gene_type:complete
MKYLGGKQKIGKYISEQLKKIDSKSVNGYLEPFCGALGVMKHMTKDYKCSASDTHCDLIELWQQVQKGKFTPPKEMTEERYLQIKELESPNALKAFVGFGCSYGGRFFGAYAQKYVGTKKENYLQAVTNSVKKMKPLIKKVSFKCCSYTKLRPKNKLIYCDPPYTNTKFPIKYRNKTKKYDEFDNKKFWQIMRKWSKNNIVFISEIVAPEDFVCVWEKKRYRSVAQSKKTRYKNEDKKSKKWVTEKLFVHKMNEKKL